MIYVLKIVDKSGKERVYSRGLVLDEDTDMQILQFEQDLMRRGVRINPIDDLSSISVLSNAH